jgi:two-component system phosphate regulon sensor histidine kinase PhoR
LLLAVTMPSAKNLSPRQLSSLTAGILALPVTLVIYIVTGNWKVSAGSLLFVFAFGYFLILFTLEKFIYRKIKLIYKMIYQTKATRKEEMYFKYLLPRKSIDEVRADVEAWGERRNREIELLRRNEAYRKEFLQTWPTNSKRPFLPYRDTSIPCSTAVWKMKPLPENFWRTPPAMLTAWCTS